MSAFTLNNPTYTTGKFGQALVLNGSGAGTGTDGKIPATGTFTANGWVKTTVGDLQVIFSHELTFWIGINNNRIVAKYGNGSNEVAMTPGPVINDGNWHHWEFTLRSDGALFFVDGSLVATSNVSEATSATDRTTKNISVGYFETYPNVYRLNGQVDEIAVWTGQLHSAAFTPPTTAYTGSETGLVNLWHFDGNANDSYTAPTPPPPATTIARDNAALRYSPYTWSDNGTSRNANTTGSYVEFGFTGTSLGMNVVALSGLTGYPVVRAYIDNAPAVDVQLASGQTAVSFATGLASGSHTARIFVAKLNEEAGWWDLTNAVKITSIVLDSGASVSAISGRSKRMLMYGDSITQGVRVFGTNPVYPTGMDGARSVAPLLAKALDAELGQVGYGAQGFTQAGNGGVPGFNTAYSSYSSGVSRLVNGVLSPAPDYVACMHGTNGSTTQSDVATAITNLRTIAPNAVILMIAPPGGFARAAITAAVNAAVAGGDRAVKLIDTGTAFQTGLTAFGAANERSPDGLHPYAWTNAELGAEMSAQIQQSIEPRRFTIVAA